jgi:hypothetical protein
MSFSYSIDAVRRVVFTRGRGIVSTRDMQDLTNRLLADPRFNSEYRALADLSEVTEVTVDALALEETASIPLYEPGTRRAIVAPSDVAYGVARMFAAYSERSGQDVRIFREMSAAEGWLGLK